MPIGQRLKKRLVAFLAARIPALAERLVASYQPQRNTDQVPWTPITKPLSECTLAVVTTAGVHHSGQAPFDMNDPDGDPSFRELDGATIADDYRISHDYYDHRDAERDLNVVLPLQRLAELTKVGLLGRLAHQHYSFMGHILGPHLATLTEKNAPLVAKRLRDATVDLVLLTPA